MAARNTIHLKLLTDISDHMDPKSSECENFVKHMTNYVPKGILSRNDTILKKLQCLETKGHLSPGNYEKLKKISKDSGNSDLIAMIEMAEADIKKVETRPHETTQISSTDPSTSVSSAASSSTPESSAASPLSKRKREDDSSDRLYRTDQDKSYYETEGKEGYLLILNSTNNRKDTDKDVESIKLFFKDKLRFHTFDPRSQEEDDLTTEKLMSCLESAKHALSDQLASTFYCFICIILSHGNEDGIATKDGMKSVEEIVKMFSNCFTGKPKLFFIQACRGLSYTGHDIVDDEADDAADNDIAEDHADELVKVPHESDILVAYATAHGRKAFRRSNVGSWFISQMIEEFGRSYTHDHVEEMLINVRQKVASMYSPNLKSMQMPCVQTTLTRRLKFK